MRAEPPVSVAVVSWNTRDLLRRCLESLVAEVDAGRCEVWVVDNASTDGSAELVREQFGWAHLIASEENLGFGRAVNLVASNTHTRWLAIANADVAPRPGALDALLSAGAAAPRCGALAPRLVLPDGTTQHSVFSFPSIAQALVIALGLPGFGARFLLPGKWHPDRGRNVPWAVAAFLLVRREAWNAVGGFDEQQWMYAEDLDLGWRLARAGWSTRYVPEAVADHESAASTEQAWGDSGKVERWQIETYAWMRRRLGAGRTTAIAAIQAAGRATRLLALVPAARIAPARFGRRRAAARWWLGLHLAGARPHRQERNTSSS